MKIIAGVDEAGRGALIGNVVAAAVILPGHYDKTLVADSKALTEVKREHSASYIKSIVLGYGIGVASAAEIDALNIHHATLLAMKRAVMCLAQDFDEVWVDGKFIPELDCPTYAFVKGDALHDCIGAASILAKTYRDAELRELAQKYPEYGFEQHKGYPTRKHREAIIRHGILAEHRKSYKTISALLQ